MSLEGNSRLIVVSNRLPLKQTKKNGKTHFSESDGGLVSSLKSFFESYDDRRFTEKYWVGAADFDESKWRRFAQTGMTSSVYKIEPLFIDKHKYSKYYNGFCNATIWPLFHYFPSYAEFDETTFSCYEYVNQLFYDRLISIVRPGDTVWIHDYQLMLLPKLLANSNKDVKIGFFLHIPFPSYEIFRLLHEDWKSKIIEGMMGADLIGFHTAEYLQHFLHCVRMITGYDHRFREIHTSNSLRKADVFPLGIDFNKFNKDSRTKSVERTKDMISKRFEGLKIIFSVDRLDYTKGVTHRLSGFEKFLDLFPEWRGRVIFILVVVPSRSIVSKYNERRKMIEEQVSRINGKYSTMEWQPIIYRYNNLSFEELSAHYQVASVALITPLRDGMNLVAKEYIASRIKDDGVLVLSELAGAASELGEAMLVNPTDRVNVARKIYSALSTPMSQQQHSMRIMRQRLQRTTVADWVANYFNALDDIKSAQGDLTKKTVTPSVVNEIRAEFLKAKKKVLLLDYDGTLVPIESMPKLAQPGKTMMELIRKLSEFDATNVVIVSGRTSDELGEWFKDLDINIIAEHGASMKMKGKHWQHLTTIDSLWKPIIRSTFESFVDRSPGSFIEEKRHTIAWHYRNVERQIGFVRSRELLDNLHHLIRNTHLNILDGHKVIEVRAAGIDKGKASLSILEEIEPDFVLAIGDDKTDEDVFYAVGNRAITVKVGGEVTCARYCLSKQDEVIELLRALL